jgi:hypothetical protein
MNAGLIILILKIAVAAVTVLWLASMAALAMGRTKLHGRINIAFFVLTLAALVGLELVARVLMPEIFDDYVKENGEVLRLHLAFSLPSAALLFVMLFTGLGHRRYLHIGAGILFAVLWAGTFYTGIFMLPHE